MKNKTPLVSVIIPVYNVEDYIEECIDSVLNQTYSNIEIVLVEDGSTDNSMQVLRKYTNENISIHKHEVNKGLAAARNTGIKACQGKYILFVDSDDLIREDTVEVLVEKIGKHNVSLVRFDAVSFNDQENTEFAEEAYNSSKYLKESVVYEDEKLNDFYLAYAASAVLYLVKKSILTQHNIQFYEGIIHEDELFTSTLYLHITSAMYVEQAFYKRRYRDNSITMIKSEEQLRKSFNSYLKIIEAYEELLKGKNLSRTKKDFIKYRINSIMYSLRDFSIDENYKSKKLSKVKGTEWYYKSLGKNYYRLLKLLLVIKNKLTS